MGWHNFSVPAENFSAPEDGSNDYACRVERDLYETLIDREMWDRTFEKLLELLPRLLDNDDITTRFEEFELFDLYDNSMLLAFRYNRSDDIWELYETSIDEEWSVDGDDADDAKPE